MRLLLLAFALASCAAAAQDAAPCSTVAAFHRVDTDSDGALSDVERSDSGGADWQNIGGLACPQGWTYLGASLVDGAYASVCMR